MKSNLFMVVTGHMGDMGGGVLMPWTCTGNGSTSSSKPNCFTGLELIKSESMLTGTVCALLAKTKRTCCRGQWKF